MFSDIFHADFHTLEAYLPTEAGANISPNHTGEASHVILKCVVLVSGCSFSMYTTV